MKRHTILTFMHELGVPGTVETGLGLVTDKMRQRILMTPVVVGKRAGRRFGSASYMAVGGELHPVKLTLNPGLLAPDMRDELIDTFLHELAHFIAETRWLTMPPILRGRSRCAGHGATWMQVMRAMGRNPRRCASADATVKLAAYGPQPKVVARCEKCGTELRGFRKRTKYDRGYWTHSACGGRIKGV